LLNLMIIEFCGAMYKCFLDVSVQSTQICSSLFLGLLYCSCVNSSFNVCCDSSSHERQTAWVGRRQCRRCPIENVCRGLQLIFPAAVHTGVWKLQSANWSSRSFSLCSGVTMGVGADRRDICPRAQQARGRKKQFCQNIFD